MLRKSLLATGLVAAISFGTPALALAHGPGGSSGNTYYGWHMCPGMMGQMGPGMMGPGYGYGMGPGMMGPGYGHGMGPGMMGRGYDSQQANLNLSTSDVKVYLDRYLAMMGNPHLKAGPVTEKDANTIAAEIVTADKSALVQRFNVDRRTGYWQPAQ